MMEQAKQELIRQYSLVKKLKRGDQSAFEEIYFLYCKPLKAFALQELKNESLADDAVQEIFCKLWLKRSQLEPGLSLKGFLFTCLKNHILNIVRTKKNEILKNYRFASQQSLSINSTEDAVISHEIQSSINQEVSKLSELKRKVLKLSLYKGLSHEQIAHELNVSVNTVKMYVSQSSRRLRKLIQMHGVKMIILSIFNALL